VKPLVLLVPNVGTSSPLCRSFRRLAAKIGMNGTSGTRFTQNEAPVPQIQSSR
jgi:hypothetical protein